jgi:hypothetical protein
MVVDGDIGDSETLSQHGVLAGAREIQDKGLRAALNSQQEQTLENQQNTREMSVHGASLPFQVVFIAEQCGRKSLNPENERLDAGRGPRLAAARGG